MTPRELFHAIMFYEGFDRMPVMHWAGWTETDRRWQEEGLPRDGEVHAFLDAVPMPPPVPVENGLFPRFEEETLEETPEYRIFRQADGVVAQHWKDRSCIPHYVDFLLKDRAGWKRYEEKLQPHPDRLPRDLDATIDRLKASGQPLAVSTGSMVGWIRDWMGVVNFAYLQYDDPQLLGEMVDTISNLVCWCLDQVLPRVRVEFGGGWEDICGRNGPLISPELFRKYAVPGYRKITSRLRDHGVQLHWVDCDGYIDPLVPLWIEGGVNVLFPVEIGAWNADPRAFRRKYGRELRIVGGIDKRALARGRPAIDAEIARRVPLMRDGGYVPLPDHVIPPDVPLADYRYYLERIRELRF
jgi:uroporphyrinogen decarboxylase